MHFYCPHIQHSVIEKENSMEFSDYEWNRIK